MTLPSWRTRLACATVIGLLTAGYADWFWNHPRPKPSDFTQPWAAARIFLQGENPYSQIGPGLAFEHEFPLIYPATSAVVAMPFAWAPPRLADALFIGIGAGLLAWALTRHTVANPQLLVFASFAMMVAAQTVQWSPVLTAAALMPWLGFLFACKPTIGMAMLIAYPSRVAFFTAGGFALLTIAIWPWWVSQWWALLPAATHMSAPVTRGGGLLIMLALIKWRRHDARLLAALACLPQTPALYEIVPLFLLVHTFREGTLLVVLTALAGKIVGYTAAGTDYHTWMAINGQWMVWLVYLPCTAMVLRRPNEGLTWEWSAVAKAAAQFKATGRMAAVRAPDRA